MEELRSANLAKVKGGVRFAWLLDYSVINNQNEKIGSAADFVAGRDLSSFAIIQIGEFLGLKTYLVAVPSKHW